jgi:hypothetical protein
MKNIDLVEGQFEREPEIEPKEIFVDKGETDRLLAHPSGSRKIILSIEIEHILVVLIKDRNAL